jgi:predicted nucleic acid-binding protein
MFDALVSGSDLAERVITIAIGLDHAAYDCFYLALAEVRDAPVITADRRLLQKTRRTPWADRVMNLRDYN